LKRHSLQHVAKPVNFSYQLGVVVGREVDGHTLGLTLSMMGDLLLGRGARVEDRALE